MKTTLKNLTLTLVLASLLYAAPASTAPLPSPPPQAAPTAAAEREQGHKLLRRGNAAEALVHLERALNLYKSAGDRAGQAATYDLLGELYERQGRYDLARSNYVSAVNLFGAGANEKDEKEEKGKKDGKNKKEEKGEKEQRYMDRFNHYLTLAKVGQMLYRTGDAAGARAYFEKLRISKPDAGAKSKASGWGKVLGGVAAGLASDEAEIRFGMPALGAGLTAKEQHDHYRRSTLYAAQELGLGRLDLEEGKLESARKHFEDLLEATEEKLPFLGKLGQTRRFRAAARTGLGETALREGKLEEAAKHFKQAAEGAEDDGRRDLMWPAQRGIGLALRLQAEQEKDEKKARKRREEALKAYREARDSVEQLRLGGVRADEARATFLSNTRVVFEEAAALSAEMALRERGSSAGPLTGEALKYAAEGLEFAEQGRARSLLDMLGEAVGRISGGIPEDLLKLKRENLEEQQEVARALTGLRLSGEKEKVDELEKRADRLHEQYESIENRIRVKSPAYAALTSTGPLPLADIQQKVLDDRTALVEYSLGEKDSYLWAVTRGGLDLYRLPGRAVVEEHAQKAREEILPASMRRQLVTTAPPEEEARGLKVAQVTDSTWDAGAFAAASHQLYKTALEPAAKFVGERRLLVVPEGALSYFPFEALVTAPGPAKFAELPYLVKSNEVVYAPSASVVAALREQPKAGGGARSVLVVADPVFSSGDPRAAQLVAAARREPHSLFTAVSDVARVRLDSVSGAARLVRLPATRDEAEQIRGLAGAAGMGADVLRDLEANESNVASRDLRGYSVVHFATHGLLDAARPQFTGLVLSLVGNAEGADGFLRTDEVFNLRLGSPLVMLSACESGLGKERRGEGVIGLARAFMYAGAPSVGVTLWSVNDRSTAELMTDFYRPLLARDAARPAAALRDARLRMIEGKGRSAPFYWAPFVLVGDWK